MHKLRILAVIALTALIPSAFCDSPEKDDLQGPFYLVDESPFQVIKILENLSGKSAIISAELPNAKINFSSQKKLAREDAINALKSVLAINGMAITPMGDKFFKVSPSKSINAQSPSLLTGKASELPASQNFYTKLYQLQYIDVDTLKDALKPFTSPNEVGTVAVFSRSNAFLFTDTLANHQRIESLLEKLDTPPLIREDVGFIQLKNTAADDMKRRITAIQGDLLKRYFEKTTIESDERTNQLIVVTQRGNLKNIRDFIEKLDIDCEPMTRSQVFYIKHGEAKDVATVLNDIVKGQQSAVKKANAANTAAVNAQNRSNSRQNYRNRNVQGAARLPTNLTADPVGASLQFSEYITIVPDERSNSIVTYGTPTDLKQIGDIIRKIDVVLAQVKIDVIVTEVTLTDNQASGLSTFGLSYSKDATELVDKGWSGSTESFGLSDSSNTPVFSAGVSERGFDLVFNVAEQNSNVKVLSAPSVVTSHNNIAKVNVSKRQPLITGITSYDATSYPTTKSTVTWTDIGIQLEVTPLIGDNGMIQMNIKQTVETVIDNTVIDTNIQPIIGKREAESFVSARSGETIILGGLQQVNNKTIDGAVFGLSDIPLLGNLFKPARESNERTELIIFIRPVIITSMHEYEGLTKEQIDASGASKEINRYFSTGKFQDLKNDNMGKGKFKQSSFWKTIYPIDSKKSDDSENGENIARDSSKASDTDGADKAEEPRRASKRITGIRK